MSPRHSNHRGARCVNCSGGSRSLLILSYIGVGTTPGIGATAFTKPYPTYAPTTPSNIETPLSPPTQPLSLSPPPTDPNQNPSIGLKPGALFYSLADIVVSLLTDLPSPRGYRRSRTSQVARGAHDRRDSSNR